jgi:hypothetical protein
MSLAEYLENKAKSWSDYIVWHMKYSSVFNLLFYPYWIIMAKEKGTVFPYYVPQAYYIRKGANFLTEKIDEFIHYHEPERDNYGSFRKNFVERLRYVVTNLHYYSNDTMANLYYSVKLPDRDYQRLKSLYNQYFFTWFGYNTASGVLLIALNNYLFRRFKATIPTALLATSTVVIMLGLNYNVSLNILERVFNNNVRRLGYGNYTTLRGEHYPRNIDYIYQ